MAQQFGVSFVPDEQNLQQGKAGQMGRGATPTQQAIRLLSLRLPRVVGGAPIAPAPLLQSQGGKGMPSPDSVAAQVLKRVLPPEQTAQASPAAPSVPQEPLSQPASGMQAPSAGYSDSARPLAQSPFSVAAPTAMTPAAPQSTPMPNIVPGVAGPDEIERLEQNPPGRAWPTPAPVPDFVRYGYNDHGVPYLGPPAGEPSLGNDVSGNEQPSSAPMPLPDTTPSYVPSQPPMSSDMQDLLDRMREKYGNPNYGEMLES